MVQPSQRVLGPAEGQRLARWQQIHPAARIALIHRPGKLDRMVAERLEARDVRCTPDCLPLSDLNLGCNVAVIRSGNEVETETLIWIAGLHVAAAQGAVVVEHQVAAVHNHSAAEERIGRIIGINYLWSSWASAFALAGGLIQTAAGSR